MWSTVTNDEHQKLLSINLGQNSKYVSKGSINV